MEQKHIRFSLWQLFSHFFRVSSLTLGGGYSMLKVFEQFYVEEKGLFSAGEWEECLIVAQSAPGAFAVNLAYLVGFHLCGTCGSVMAILGMVLPAFLSMLIAGSLILNFVDEWYVRSFLKGVVCGPIVYYTITFRKLSRTAFQRIWMAVSFFLFTALQLLLDVPVFFIIGTAIVLIGVQLFWFSWRGFPPLESQDKEDV